MDRKQEYAHVSSRGQQQGRKQVREGEVGVVSLRWYTTEQKSQKGASHGENGGRLLQVKGAASTNHFCKAMSLTSEGRG